jgi:hypothetical protein
MKFDEGKCGGNGWTGDTDCGPSAYCRYESEWYSQCVPVEIGK